MDKMSLHPAGKSFFFHLWKMSLGVFIGQFKPDQVKSSAIKFLAESLMLLQAATVATR
jgi:hypothetical protein